VREFSSPHLFRVKFENEIIEGAEMLIMTCRSNDAGDANAGILASVEAADLTVHARCQNAAVLS
jgi:hypothetical protein